MSMNELGDWTVDVNEDVAPDMVEVKLSELGEDGIFGHTFYLSRQAARDFAAGLVQQADWLDTYS